MTALRLMSFNIRHGASALNRLDLTRTADVLRRGEADVIALQEVDRCYGERSAYEDQAARLAEILGMDALYAPAITRPAEDGREEPREYGIALLSRLPMRPLELGQEQPGRIPLPLAVGVEGRFPEPRVALGAQIDLTARGGGEVTVLTTHLDAFTPAHRAAQVAHLAAVLAPLAGPSALVGDMNARSGAPELEPLRTTGWREARAREAGLSRLLGRTFPALTPWRRIDQVRLRGPIRMTQLRTVRTWASDHFPIIADLHVR